MRGDRRFNGVSRAYPARTTAAMPAWVRRESAPLPPPQPSIRPSQEKAREATRLVSAFVQHGRLCLRARRLVPRSRATISCSRPSCVNTHCRPTACMNTHKTMPWACLMRWLVLCNSGICGPPSLNPLTTNSNIIPYACCIVHRMGGRSVEYSL